MKILSGHTDLVMHSIDIDAKVQHLLQHGDELGLHTLGKYKGANGSLGPVTGNQRYNYDKIII